jgi:hypothetical protein
VKNVHHHETSGVHQNNVAADDGMPAIGRRRRQPPFQIIGAGLHLFAQARRKSAAHHELSFEPGRQPVPLGEPGREAVAMVAIPPAHLIAIVIVVTVAVSVLIFVFIFIVVTVVIIVIAMLVVTVAASLPAKSRTAA